MNNKQLGKLVVTLDMFHGKLDQVAAIFAMLKLIPVRAETLYFEQRISYTAISERFDEVPDGERIPEYKLTISADKNGWPNEVKVTKVL